MSSYEERVAAYKFLERQVAEIKDAMDIGAEPQYGERTYAAGFEREVLEWEEVLRCLAPEKPWERRIDLSGFRTGFLMGILTRAKSELKLQDRDAEIIEEIMEDIHEQAWIHPENPDAAKGDG